MAGEVLDVSERHPGVERCGDGAVAEAVGADPVSRRKAGSSGETAHEAPGAGFGHALASAVQEDRPGALGDVRLQRPSRGRGEGLGAALGTLACEFEDPVAEVMGEVLDVAGEGLVDAQPVERQQGDERCRAQPVGLGGLQELHQLLLVETDRRGVIRDRAEVEQWLAEPDRPTEHPQVPATTVFNNYGTWQASPVVQASPNATVRVISNTQGQQLANFVQQYHLALESMQLESDEREDIEADLRTIEEQVGTGSPDESRLRTVIHRLLDWTGAAAAAGVSSVVKQEIESGGHQLLRALGVS
jgi:hypothetical protein